MQRVDEYETEEQVMMNRIRMRKYLRELMFNQKRLLEKVFDESMDDMLKEL